MHITLEGHVPSVNSLYRRHGHIIYMTTEGKNIKAKWQNAIREQYKGELLTGNLLVDVTLYFGNMRRRDADNAMKLIGDSFNGIVWKDDSQIIDLLIHKRYDKINPRVEIIIKEYGKGTN